MQNLKRQLDPNLLAIINLLGLFSLLGFLYCMLVLLHGKLNIEANSVALYAIWFVVSFISTNLMKMGDIWGAYALGIATIAIGIYEILNATASLGGALSAVFVMLVLISYIKNLQSQIRDATPEAIQDT